MSIEKTIESKFKLLLLLKELGFENFENLIEEGVINFRNCYQQRTNRYPGDYVYYDLFKQAVLTGMSINDSKDKVEEVINIQLKKLDIFTHVYGNKVEILFIL